MDENNVKLSKDDLNQALDRTNEWIENCDTKASIVLGGIGVVFGILLASDYVKKISEIFNAMIKKSNCWSCLYMFLCVVAIGAIFVGTFFIIKVLVPKINTSIYSTKGIISDSIIFFGTIAKNETFQDYKTKIDAYSESDLLNDIKSQIYICSMICDKKFKNYKLGLTISISGFSAFAILMIIGIWIT